MIAFRLQVCSAAALTHFMSLLCCWPKTVQQIGWNAQTWGNVNPPFAFMATTPLRHLRGQHRSQTKQKPHPIPKPPSKCPPQGRQRSRVGRVGGQHRRYACGCTLGQVTPQASKTPGHAAHHLVIRNPLGLCYNFPLNGGSCPPNFMVWK